MLTAPACLSTSLVFQVLIQLSASLKIPKTTQQCSRRVVYFIKVPWHLNLYRPVFALVFCRVSRRTASLVVQRLTTGNEFVKTIMADEKYLR